VTSTSREPLQDWRRLVAVFWIAQLVETIGVSQVFALLPNYLRQLGVPEADRLPFIGLYSSLIFVLGLPLVPLWGVWADKISRKAVIVRSSLVLASVLLVASLAREPWQMAVAVMLIGLQLGNTGVMLAGIRDVTPRARLGVTIALFGAAGPVGFAVGPGLAGILIDGLGWSISGVYAASAGLALATATLLVLGTREVRPDVVPQGPVLRLAFGAVRGVLSDPAIRRLFAVYGVVFLANQVSRPYTPVLVEGITGTGPGLATGIGLVMGVGSLVGALASPAAGWIGDRVGFRPVLIVSLTAGGIASVLMPAAPGLWLLTGASVLLGAAVATTGAMVMSLLATEVPAQRRSATLNLVYLPLYIAGVVGPAMGSGVAAATGPGGPFVLGAIVFLAGAVFIALRRGGPAAPVADRTVVPVDASPG
jgi:MFS transporter, DHA1 family, multidrug resistance protein